jgi:GDSL-like Lipase/Acylhydrolase family
VSWRVLLVCGAAWLVVMGLGVPAEATPGSPGVSIVTLGDSFISGEAGRWQGNSLVSTGDRAGTDRAWTGSGYDPSRVYGSTAADGCHRSDVAEVNSTAVASMPYRINLACSGAVTANLFRESNGGQSQNGEPLQATKLKFVAQISDAKVVVISIGGNDLGFADIIRACAEAYAAKTGPCNPSQQAVVDSRWKQAFTGVAKAIDEVRAVMAERGYARSDYRLIVQSYGSPVPRASETRYAEIDPNRGAGGCPFYDADLNWARNSLVNQISRGLMFVAASKHVEFLDLRDSLQGHEVCATAAKQATLTDPPAAATSEWARFLTLNLVQGDIQETLHPNFFAQKALGRCLTLAVNSTPGLGSCRPTPGQGPTGMVYSR